MLVFKRIELSQMKKLHNPSLSTSLANKLTVNDFKKELDNYFQNIKTYD